MDCPFLDQFLDFDFQRLRLALAESRAHLFWPGNMGICANWILTQCTICNISGSLVTTFQFFRYFCKHPPTGPHAKSTGSHGSVFTSSHGFSSGRASCFVNGLTGSCGTLTVDSGCDWLREINGLIPIVSSMGTAPSSAHSCCCCLSWSLVSLGLPETSAPAPPTAAEPLAGGCTSERAEAGAVWHLGGASLTSKPPVPIWSSKPASCPWPDDRVISGRLVRTASYHSPWWHSPLPSGKWRPFWSRPRISPATAGVFSLWSSTVTGQAGLPPSQHSSAR